MFDGRVALVTGGSSGIGLETAKLYAEEGAKVVIADIDDERGEKAAAEIGEMGGEAQFVRTDVSQADECKALIQAAVERFGRLDYACNNAGVGGEQNPTGSYSVEDWDQVIAINLSGVFYCMKHEIEAMLEAGGGSIVNMSSILGQVGFANSPAYVSAKHGLSGLTKTAALEYAQHGIRVNSVGPAFIRTPLLSALEENPEVMQHIVSLHPMNRLGTPREVAELVIWLSSDKASFVTGSYYPVDGGYLAR